MLQAVMVIVGVGAVVLAVRCLRGAIRARRRVCEGRAYPTDFALYGGFANLNAATERFGMPDDNGFCTFLPSARPAPSLVYYVFVTLDCLSIFSAAASLPSWPLFGQTVFFWLLSAAIVLEAGHYLIAVGFALAIVWKTWGLNGIP